MSLKKEIDSLITMLTKGIKEHKSIETMCEMSPTEAVKVLDKVYNTKIKLVETEALASKDDNGVTGFEKLAEILKASKGSKASKKDKEQAEL